MSQTVAASHHTPRRLCFPAPLFSLAGGLSQREAVLTSRPAHHSGGTDTSEERPSKTADESEPTLLNPNQTPKSCFSLLLMLRFVSETRPDVRVPESGC